ncbi:MAG: DEAD/DEAH box helicase, partial [Anaerolineae bacterium]|nr:DEAD/DEAH box helicase [Anaerolineae bacterium]
SRRLPLKIERMVGIAPNELRDAPPFEAIQARITRLLGSHPVVGHGIDTDISFLSRYGLTPPHQIIDTFELASILVPEARRYTLSHLAKHMGIAHPNAHRALDDAMAAKDLFLALLERLANWDLALIREVADSVDADAWPLKALLEDVLQNAPLNLRQAGAPRGAEGASSGHSQGAVRIAPLKPHDTIQPLDVEALTELFEQDGPFAKTLSGYEYRSEQVTMMQEVARALNGSYHLMVEAGTGVGKSLAYLLPAVTFAVQNGRRVVISSNTINLQDQVAQKDLPDLQRALGLKFHVAVLKGRGNYLCLRRLRVFRRSRHTDTTEARVLAKVLYWLGQTKTGDQNELLLVNDERQVWGQIQSTSEYCLGDRCPYRANGECFYYRARAQAERAHVLVVNHALLLADLGLENRVLPQYDYVIIDEAHHLEDRATDQMSMRVGRREIELFLAGVGTRTRGRPEGIVGRLPMLFLDKEDEASQKRVASLLEEVASQADRARRGVVALFQRLGNFFRGQRPLGGNYDQEIMITSATRIQPDWSDVEIAWEDYSAPMSQVIAGLEKVASLADDSDLTEEDEECQDLLQELKMLVERGHSLVRAVDEIVMEPTDNGIYWVTMSRRDGEMTLASAPLRVAPILSELLFHAKKSVILTSATLRTAGSFRYMEDRIGLEEPEELAVGSPFDYKSAVLLYVPNDIPEPNEQGYQEAVEHAIVELCQATEGRALVLFTSISQLRNTYYDVRHEFERSELVLLGQGIDGSRRHLLDTFRTSERAVLFGTRSFWEGVDVVGEALSCLVIARLPFAVPTDPVFYARAKTFDDPFNQYQVPDAILRLRQGFGRLIRSKEDYGIVAVLDRRLLTKRYGATMLRSLPACTARQGPVASLPGVARAWLDPSLRASNPESRDR